VCSKRDRDLLAQEMADWLEEIREILIERDFRVGVGSAYRFGGSERAYVVPRFTHLASWRLVRRIFRIDP
jgi:hypothetical protein